GLVGQPAAGVRGLEVRVEMVHRVLADRADVLPVRDGRRGARGCDEQQRDQGEERPLHVDMLLSGSRNRSLAVASASLRSRRARRSPSRRSPTRTSLSLTASGAGIPSPLRLATNAAGSTACASVAASSLGPPAATRSSG